MTDDTTPTPPARPLSLGRFVLARTARLSRSGGRSLTRRVLSRHAGQRLAAAPRLAPVGRMAVARSAADGGGFDAAPAAPVDDAALRDEATRMSSISGYTPDAMQYLLGNAPAAGQAPPSLGDAATGVRQIARERSAARAQTPRRATIEEGAARPLRLSRTPRSDGAGTSPATPPEDSATASASFAPADEGDPAARQASPAVPEPLGGASRDAPAATSASTSQVARSTSTSAKPAGSAPPDVKSAPPPPARVPVRVARRPAPSAPSRPVVQRVARAERQAQPAVHATTVEPPATPAPGPARRLLRRVVDSLRGAPPEREATQPQPELSNARSAPTQRVSVALSGSKASRTDHPQAESEPAIATATDDDARLSASPAVRHAPRLAPRLLRRRDTTKGPPGHDSPAPTAAPVQGERIPVMGGQQTRSSERSAPASSSARRLLRLLRAPATNADATRTDATRTDTTRTDTTQSPYSAQVDATAAAPSPIAAVPPAADEDPAAKSSPSRAVALRVTDPPTGARRQAARAMAGRGAEPATNAALGPHASHPDVGLATEASPPPTPPAQGRARLRVLRNSAPTPQAPASPPPARQQSSPTAQLLARSTAGAIDYEDGGRASVLFPPPGAVFDAPSAVVAREPIEPAALTSQPPAQAQPATTAPASAAAEPLDRDELYSDFMRRLRRDVLEQREQLGEPR